MQRPSAKQLLQHPLVASGRIVETTPTVHSGLVPLRCESLGPLKVTPFFGSPLEERPLQELYSLWRLAGGDAEAELRRQGCLRAKPPICTLPCIVLLEGEELGQKKDAVFFYDDTIVPLPTEQLCQVPRSRAYFYSQCMMQPVFIAEAERDGSEPLLSPDRE